MRQLAVHGAGPAADIVGRKAELDALAAALAQECLPARVGVDGVRGAPSAAAGRTAAGWAELSCNRVVEFHGADPEEDVR